MEEEDSLKNIYNYVSLSYQFVSLQKFQFLLQKLGRILLSFPKSKKQKKNKTDGYNIIGHFTVVYLVAKSLIWSEAEGHLVVIETSI